MIKPHVQLAAFVPVGGDKTQTRRADKKEKVDWQRAARATRSRPKRVQVRSLTNDWIL